MAEKITLSFEEALKRLENLVTQLEDENVTLDDSLKLYEEAMALTKHCSDILEKAELRIEKVNSNKTE